jgi:hypothetical protein
MDLGKIHCDAQYIVSIAVLLKDITHSVIRCQGGYLDDLSNDADIQSKFVKAINQIYDPIITD